MQIPSLIEPRIRDRATAQVFQRGEQYYHSDAVAGGFRIDISDAPLHPRSHHEAFI